MAKKKFTKPFATHHEQLEKLQERGLVISDLETAGAFLSYCNYYRFSGYVLPFESERHVILPQTTFEQIRYLYEFDRTLRCLVSEAIAVIEISVKSRVAYQLGVSKDPFLHKNRKVFQNVSVWKEWLGKVRKETESSKETFVAHFKSTYAEYPDLPIWVLTELMSFGSLSKFYSQLQWSYQRPIAWHFGVPHKILVSWLHSLTHIRNLCAHHARLWDRHLDIFPKVPHRRPEWDSFRVPGINRRIFCALSVIKFLLDKIKEQTKMDIDWSPRIVNLLRSRPNVPNFENLFGLPNDWQQSYLWER
jgi:abortive infection bacteriophage resistance protein